MIFRKYVKSVKVRGERRKFWTSLRTCSKNYYKFFHNFFTIYLNFFLNFSKILKIFLQIFSKFFKNFSNIYICSNFSNYLKFFLFSEISLSFPALISSEFLCCYFKVFLHFFLNFSKVNSQFLPNFYGFLKFSRNFIELFQKLCGKRFQNILKLLAKLHDDFFEVYVELFQIFSSFSKTYRLKFLFF